MEELEEFDFNYEDDMEALYDMENEINPAPTLTPRPSTSNQNVELPSPQMSEIHCSTGKKHFGRLTDEPVRHQRFVSTPFPSSFMNEQPDIIDLDSDNVNIVRTKKRRLELDDFSDLPTKRFLEQGDSNAKKLKSEEEADLELIATILNARQRLQTNTDRNWNNQEMRRLDLFYTHKVQNLSHTVPKWPFLKLTKEDSDRVYVRFHSEEFEENQIKELRQIDLDQCSLFGDQKQEMWDEARKIINHRLEQRNNTETQDLIDTSAINPADINLWVEKYKPKKYFELLSDESCNRNLLKWIKLWDKVVFQRDVKPKAPSIDTARNDNNNKKFFNTFNKRTGRFEPRNTLLNTELDEFNCPIQKIVLLAGEPGVGKTTMAHNIARQAGYHPVEINSSDDRTVEAFKIALENGTQIKNVFTSEKRPNCLILDEIDGAPTPTIDFLVRYVLGTVKVKSGKQANKTKFVLKRPIICVCNDLYAVSLRSLKAIAYVIVVPPTDDTRLVNRLYQICLKQRIKTNMSTLYSLVEKAGNDIRTCLSLLQFFTQSKKELSLCDVLNTNIGIKDHHKEIFQVWSTIFQIPRSYKNIKTTAPKTETPISSNIELRIKNVLDAVSMHNEYEKLMQGIFENYLHVRSTAIEGATEILNWFSFNDQIIYQINREQTYGTYKYLPYAFASWHLSLSSMAWQKINYPSKSYEVSQKLNATKSLLEQVIRGLSNSVRGIGSTTLCIHLNSLLYVRHIISPQLRSVSLQLLSNEERLIFEQTVQIMVDMGLSYLQFRTADGTVQYNLNPNIDYLFELVENAVPQISPWCKQLISREVEIAKIQRNQVKSAVAGDGRKAQDNSSKKVDKDIPNFMVRLQCKSLPGQEGKGTEAVRKDFFGRVLNKELPQTTTNNQSTQPIIKGSIWYSYKEGFNNAVRKNLNVADFI